MKKYQFLCAAFLTMTTIANAQWGFTIAPTNSRANDWQVLVENFITKRHTDFLKHGNAATLDYTFQLKSPAWELRPAIHGMRSSMIFDEFDFDIYALGLQGNINFALFKMEAKDRPAKATTLYFQFSPGISFVRQELRKALIEDGLLLGFETTTNRQLAFNAGLGILLEWQLTQLLSLSPTCGIRYYPRLEWDGFSKAVSGGTFNGEYDTVDWRQLYFGLRIGLDLKEGPANK